VASKGEYHLIHANVAHARAPLESRLMAGFVAQVEEVNALAARSPGFVAQPALPDAGTVYAEPYLLNVSIWRSIESIAAFTHQGLHGAALERRADWFHQGSAPNYVLYWVPAGHIPTEAEVKHRLDHLAAHGATPYAFTFERPFTVAEALVFVQ
jgi:hypothetical protein